MRTKSPAFRALPRRLSFLLGGRLDRASTIPSDGRSGSLRGFGKKDIGGRVLRGVPWEQVGERDVDETLPKSSQSQGSNAGGIVAMLVVLERSDVSFMIVMQLQSPSKSVVLKSEA